MLHPSSDIGATIDFNGETVVTYNEDAYRVIKLSNSSYSGFALVNSPDADYWWHIGKMAMDSRHSRLAIVFQEGRITVEGILAPRIFPLSRIDVLENGTKHELQPVEFAAFDPSGKWLAVVRADELSIWSVANWKKAIIYQAPIRNVSGIEFNPSGELLFVATDNEIRAIGLEKKELIFEFDAPGVSSLHVDEDNRLLFWGDEEGVIHIRGVLRKN
jgi:WD40 repeat protein